MLSVPIRSFVSVTSKCYLICTDLVSVVLLFKSIGKTHILDLIERSILLSLLILFSHSESVEKTHWMEVSALYIYPHFISVVEDLLEASECLFVAEKTFMWS